MNSENYWFITFERVNFIGMIPKLRRNRHFPIRNLIVVAAVAKSGQLGIHCLLYKRQFWYSIVFQTI